MNPRRLTQGMQTHDHADHAPGAHLVLHDPEVVRVNEETARRYRDETIDELAGCMMATITDALSEDDGIVELIESYAADTDMVPLDPHPVKVLNKSGDDLDAEDYAVLNQYLAYERLEQDLLGEAKIRLIGLLAKEPIEEIRRRQSVAEGARDKIVGVQR